jgi:diadenosine tetraphosphate (Ap4A) HIT family hydrolase
VEESQVSFHTNYAEWLRLAEPQNCPVCAQAPMGDGMLDIVELTNSWLDAAPVDCLKGACHLVAKRHAVELYDLDDAGLLGLMKEVQICARALQRVTGAVKINYEIHGNTVPHLHIHLYPRYLDDPFPGQAIDYSQQQNWFAEGEFEQFVEQMREEIHGLSEYKQLSLFS